KAASDKSKEAILKSGIKKFFGGPDVDDADEVVSFVERGSGDGAVDAAAEPVADEAVRPTARAATKDATAVSDRVVSALLRNGSVTVKQVREVELHWKRAGQQDTLWRTLAASGGVNAEAVYAEAARIYAFRQVELDPAKVDADFINRVVDSFTPEQKRQLVSLRLLPLEYEIDPDRGILRLVFATRDPMRPETLRFIHDLQLDHFELRYAPESRIKPVLEELFPKENEFLKRLEEDEDAGAYDLGASYEEGRQQL